MKESMIDILVYLFENYLSSQEVPIPDQDRLALKLSAAGFESEEINQALDWLDELRVASERGYAGAIPSENSYRVYSVDEGRKIDEEGRGFLGFLQNAGVLNAAQRELVIDRVMALDDDEISLDTVKWIVLMVLWSQGKTQDYLFLEELLFGDAIHQVH